MIHHTHRRLIRETTGVVLLACILLVSGCGGAAGAPSGSATPNPAASAQPTVQTEQTSKGPAQPAIGAAAQTSIALTDAELERLFIDLSATQSAYDHIAMALLQTTETDQTKIRNTITRASMLDCVAVMFEHDGKVKRGGFDMKDHGFMPKTKEFVELGERYGLMVREKQVLLPAVGLTVVRFPFSTPNDSAFPQILVYPTNGKGSMYIIRRKVLAAPWNPSVLTDTQLLLDEKWGWK